MLFRSDGEVEVVDDGDEAAVAGRSGCHFVGEAEAKAQPLGAAEKALLQRRSGRFNRVHVRGCSLIRFGNGLTGVGIWRTTATSFEAPIPRDRSRLPEG